MLPISKILVPVDFSERCLAILPLSQAIASRYEAELILLHVVNPVLTIPPIGPLGGAVFSVPRSFFEDATKQLDVFGADQLQGHRVRRLIYEGDPAEEIVSCARLEEVQLVIMPTHGMGMLRRFLIGSVTAKVLHDAACPVLTGVHLEETPQAKPFTVSNILCAVDLGPRSQSTLAWAAGLADDFQARLGIAHASEKEGLDRDKIQALRQSAGATSASIHVQEGEPVKTVVELANSLGADLLVIGRASDEELTGRLRPNAYAIISQSPCPVVSI